jgi:outer membrane protein TolC
MKALRFLLLNLFLAVTGYTQSLDSVLAVAERNNPSLKVAKQQMAALSLVYKTGLTPANPFAEYEYLKGSPAEAGNQEDFTIIQSFDFPTAYSKRSQLSRQQIRHAELTYRQSRMKVLQEARETCIELIYLNKLKNILEKRVLGNEKLVSDYRTLLQKGDGNILDVSKAELQLLEVKRKFSECTNRISALNVNLQRITGGEITQFTDSIYPVYPAVIDSAALFSLYMQQDPELMIRNQEMQVSMKQLELNKALRLPAFEAGYHYQGILGQTYSGIHTGITLPLWENKNRVKASRVQVALAETESRNYQLELQNRIGNLYARAIALQKTIADYNAVFSQINDEELLAKALRLGQISVIEYFMELTYYSNAHENFLLAEREYHDVISDLYSIQR